MRRNYRWQIAMRRDWSWQNALIQKKARKSSRTLGPLVAVLSTLAIIAIVAGIVIAQHASSGTSIPARAGQGSNSIVGQQSAQTPATPQIRTGVFAPGDEGPIPVPANVLKPVNGARTILNNEIYSLYAGSLTRQPEIGALAVLRENIQSGQQSLHIYQSPRHLGALTILSLRQNIVTFTAASGSQGRFNLLTDQFQ